MCDDKITLIASMAATLEAGDRAAGRGYDTPMDYAYRAHALYHATIAELDPRETVDEEQEEAA